MATVDYDVAVVGAGPAGSSAAVALAGLGWSVLLIEQDRLPRHKVCGEFLSPEAQDSLRTLGLHADLATLQPIPLDDAQLTSRRGSDLCMALPAPAWGLSRFALDTALAQAAVQRGVTFWEASTVLGLEPNRPTYASSRTLTIRRERRQRTVKVRTVILAGGRSLTTQLMGRPTGPRPARLNVGVKAHFAGVSMPNRVELHLFDGGYVGVNPVETGAVNVCLLASYAAFAAAGRSATGMLASIAHQNPAFAKRLSGAELLEKTVSTVAAVDTGRPSRPWNGAACLGDAATMIPPLCGDGMAMAIHSATLCVPFADAFLRGEIDVAQWETLYCAHWHTAFDRRLRVGRTLQALLNSRVSDFILRSGRHLPQVANYLLRATRGPISASSSVAGSTAAAAG